MINSYFTGATVGHTSEQDLVESMTVESIQISGMNVIYIPRSLNKVDQIFGEDVLSSFESYAEIEMYLSDFAGYGGQSEMLSKFGMQISDTASFLVSRKRYGEIVVPILPESRNTKVMNRPNEGDLIYVSNSKSLFEIVFVEDEEPGFHQLNKKYVWTLRCELMRMNNDKISTGHTEVDDIFGVNMNRLDMSILLETGFHLLTETGGYVLLEDYEVSKEYDDTRGYGDNDVIKKEFLEIMDFDQNNPFRS